MQAAKRATERGRMLGLQASKSRGGLEGRKIWIVAINDSHQEGDPKKSVKNEFQKERVGAK